MTRTAIAALCAAAISLVGCASDGATGEPRPTTSTSASVSVAPSEEPSGSIRASAEPMPTPSPSERPPTITWNPAVTIDGLVTDIYADGDTWIAGGWHPDDGPAAWTSVDGVTWARSAVENPQPDELFAGPRLGPIERVGDSLVSFGTFIGAGDGRGVYGWRSTDGSSWDAIESSSPLFESGYFVSDVAAGEPALVAAESQFALYAGRLWTWTEGTSWVETTPTSTGASSGLQVSDVVWALDRFVAVGARPADDSLNVPRGTSWVSTDGRTWEESAPDSTLEGVELTRVEAVPEGGFVALGFRYPPLGSPGGTTFAMTSSDGLEWVVGPEQFDNWPNEDLPALPDELVPFIGPRMGNDIVFFTADYESMSTSVQVGTISR